MESCEETNLLSDSICFGPVRQLADTVTGGGILEVTLCNSRTSHKKKNKTKNKKQNKTKQKQNLFCTTTACVLQPVALCFVELAREMFF